MPANRIKIEPSLARRYKKQTAKRSSRKIVTRILIVCEGEKTEPLYFKALSKDTNINLTIEGIGDNTLNVVDKAISMRDQVKDTNSEYDRVWAVFDKDSFPSSRFNTAIKKANSNDICCAWSNEAFELWYLYHFLNRITPMSREDYKKAISEAVNNSSSYKSKKKYVYKKSDPENYSIVSKFGSQENAIKWARDQSESYEDHGYSNHNPCTMVYKLVLQLIGQDEDFNNELSNKLK